MKSDLGDVLTALDLSARTFRRIRLNYCWAFGYNTLMIPLAAGVLYPSTQWQMPPWVAGALQFHSPCLCDSQLRSMIPLTAGALRAVADATLSCIYIYCGRPIVLSRCVFLQ